MRISAKFKKKSKMTFICLLDFNIAEKNEQLVTLFSFCPKIFLVTFFVKFCIARLFQNAQILAIWFSEWKVMTI
jgi:hypothetical protein